MSLIDGSMLRRHGSHAWCAFGRLGLCVPAFLHEEFLGKSGKSEAAVRAWYADTVAGYEGVPIGEDTLVFWRRNFTHWIGAATPTAETKTARNVAAASRVLSQPSRAVKERDLPSLPQTGLLHGRAR